MLYPLENEEQGINTRVFTCIMSVLECANKLLEILAVNDIRPKLRWSENGDLKFSDSKEGEEDSKKPRSTGTISPCRRGIDFTPWEAQM